MHLTGNYRYRIGWFGRVVLQVETQWVTVNPFCEEYYASKWRDAKPLDVSVIEAGPKTYVPYQKRAPAT